MHAIISAQTDTSSSQIPASMRTLIENTVAQSTRRYHTVASIAQTTHLNPDLVVQVLESSPGIRRSFVLTPTGIHWYAAKDRVSLFADLWMGFRAVNSLKYGTWR